MLLKLTGKPLKTTVKEIGLCAEKSYYSRPEAAILEGPTCKLGPWLAAGNLAHKLFPIRT